MIASRVSQGRLIQSAAADWIAHSSARKQLHRDRRTRCACKREDEDVDAKPVDQHRLKTPGHDQEDKEPHKSLIKDLSKSVMPQEAGDCKDYFWMILSTVVLVYFSACLFMIYDYLYRAAGFVTIAEFIAQ